MRRWRWLGIGLVIVVVGIGVLLLVIGGAPGVSSVQSHPCIIAAESCLRFPVVSGDSLSGQSYTLPADLQGKLVLVIVPFDESQQTQAQDWLPMARDLAAANPDFGYYDVPVFPSMNSGMRLIIRAGMNALIPDTQLRAVTITVFLDDLTPFLSSLNLPDASLMQVFLLNANGEVIWRGSGDFTDAQGDAIKALVG